nr:unnamed protein product [Haemonchus contortus]
MVEQLFQPWSSQYAVVNMGKKDSGDELSIDDLKEEAKELVTKIQKHFIAIEEHRRKDRELWRSFNRRLESLEEVIKAVKAALPRKLEGTDRFESRHRPNPTYHFADC